MAQGTLFEGIAQVNTFRTRTFNTGNEGCRKTGRTRTRHPLDQRRKGRPKPHTRKALAYQKKWEMQRRAKLKAEMIVAYGGRCACCGQDEPAFLQLDHVYNDGADERRKFRHLTQFFADLKSRGWPTDRYQLLCANCNFGKLLNDGVCPHKELRTDKNAILHEHIALLKATAVDPTAGTDRGLCAVCGAVFVKSRSDSSVCSRKCRYRAGGALKRRKSAMRAWLKKMRAITSRKYQPLPNPPGEV